MYSEILNLSKELKALAPRFKENRAQAKGKRRKFSTLRIEIEEIIYNFELRKKIADERGYRFVGNFSPQGFARALTGNLEWVHIDKQGNEKSPRHTVITPFKNGFCVIGDWIDEETSHDLWFADKNLNVIKSHDFTPQPGTDILDWCSAYSDEDWMEGLKLKVNKTGKETTYQYFDKKGTLLFTTHDSAWNLKIIYFP